MTQINQSGNDSKVVSGDYVEGDKVEVEGDYVKGDKIAIDQTAKVSGDFTQITNFLKSGSTGIFVTLVLNVADFVGERKSSRKPVGIDDYLEWLHRPNHQEFLDRQRNLLDALRRQDEGAQLVRSSMETIIRLVEHHSDKLQQIVEQTKLLPDMDSKLDYLVNQLSKEGAPGLQRGQLAISARVLDILSSGLVGAGVKVMMKKEVNVHVGTVVVVWLLGTQSPHMMLLDLVGDIHQNRMSLILNSDASINLRVYDGDSHKVEVKSKSYPPGHQLVIFGIWQDRKISLWINGENQGSASMTKGFDYFGPVCLFGIDIEGTLSADAVRWTPPGQEVGLNFKKNGIWHGSRYDTVIMFDEALNKQQIDTLTQDPWGLFRRPKTDEGDGKAEDYNKQNS